jgi:HEAT repeats
MQKHTSFRYSPVVVFVFLALFLTCIKGVYADPGPNPDSNQFNALARQLLESKSHRMRARAAYSLEKFPGPKTQDLLFNALMDGDESVRLATLSSLAKVGDSQAIEVLRSTTDENHVVREELRRTLVVLEDKFPQVRASVKWNEVSGVIQIGTMYGKTGHFGELTTELRRYLALHIRLQKGLAVVESLKEKNRTIKKNSIKPLMVTGNLKSLTRKRRGNSIDFEATVSIVVLDYPGKSIRSLITQAATVRRPLNVYQANQDVELCSQVIQKAMKAVAMDLNRNLADL